jgi:hypothetical protein
MAEVVLPDSGAVAVDDWGSLRRGDASTTQGRQPGPGGWRWINHPGADTDWVPGTWVDGEDPAGIEFRVIDDAVHARTTA